MSKKVLKNILISVLAFLFGACGGVIGFVYVSLPTTEDLNISEEEIYAEIYSTDQTKNVKAELTGADDELSIHFLELGNKYTGDCTYIKYRDIDILIDCGSKTSSISVVSNYLKHYMNDNVLEYVIVTHAHLDHYAGFATSQNVDGIFELFECENIIDFGDATNQTGKIYQNYVQKRDAEISLGANYYPATSNSKGNNQMFILDDQNNLVLEILYNRFQQERSSQTENDYSVCSLLTYGEKNFLFTGDLENTKHGEEYLLQDNNIPTSVEVYKAGHHGSKTSSSDALLSHINPKIVCVCCCAGSPEYTKTANNQFPTQEFISRLAARNITQVFVTTLCLDWQNSEFTSMNGNITVLAYASNQNVELQCSNNSIILKETLWFKKNRVWS